jgi:SAM-dependent methyltransferase
MLVSLLQKSGQDKEIGKYIKKVEVSIEARKNYITNLLSDLNSIHYKTGKSRWSQYYSDMDSFFSPQQFNAKQKVVSCLLRDLKPKTVTDIGCNLGGYAILAAQHGASVTAFDTDEDSINMFYQLVKAKNLDILPLVLDVTNPSPATGWRSKQYTPAVERFKSEGALALALVHHLAITQGQSFDRIVEELADYCKKWLITEFVPPDDPRSKELLLTCRRDMSWYTLGEFLSSLESKFGKVTTFESHPSGRILILCEK